MTTPTTSKTSNQDTLQIYLHVVTLPGDPPSVYAGWACFKNDGSLKQSELREVGVAVSYAQGTLNVLVRVLRASSECARPMVVQMADGQAVALLRGDVQPTTPRIAKLLGQIRTLLASRKHAVEFRRARWDELTVDRPDLADAWS